nr:sigma-70 family RNA polymerase sigma factor [Ruminiclostridium sufflavum]
MYYVEAYKNGDEEARNVLIERNLRLVAHIVKKYGSCGNDSDDLISIGTIGLIKAISTFNVDKGTRLATYAARCIENAILTCYTQITSFGYHLKKILIFFLRGSLDENMNLVVSAGVRYNKYFFNDFPYQL